MAKRPSKPAKPQDADGRRALVDEGKALIEKHRASAPPNEQDFLEHYLKMLLRTSRIARRLERQILEDPDKRIDSRDVYALSNTYSQLREIIADLRTITDMSSQVDALAAGPIANLVSSIGQLVLNGFYQQQELIRQHCKPDEVQVALQKLKKLTEDLGDGLDKAADHANQQVAQLLLAPSEDLPTTKKKRRR